jgi:hypothetical protein
MAAGRAPSPRHDAGVQTQPDAPPPRGGALEIRGPSAGLLDDVPSLRARGAGEGAGLSWRARLRDDDGRVWRAAAARAEDLAGAWRPAKAGTGPVAALRSLRPVAIDVRVEGPDGRSAARTIQRRLLADGVQVRRWRGDVVARLHLPAGDVASALLVDATGGPGAAAVAALAAALLASRGVLVLAVEGGRGGASPGAVVAEARERLTAVPAAAGAEVHMARAASDADGAPSPPDVVVLPPGVPATDGPAGASARAEAWDALLRRLGAAPRA